LQIKARLVTKALKLACTQQNIERAGRGNGNWTSQLAQFPWSHPRFSRDDMT
jgi:hypothetical protein